MQAGETKLGPSQVSAVVVPPKSIMKKSKFDRQRSKSYNLININDDRKDLLNAAADYKEVKSDDNE